MTPEAKRRAIGLLRLEIENLRQRGFCGLLCLGMSATAATNCHQDCPLFDLAPPERRKMESPCRHIPLNELGETVDRISKERDQTYLEDHLLRWMEQTALDLQNQL